MRAAHSPCQPVVMVDKLVAGYGDKSVLKELSTQVGRGQFVGILGPNGAGKTTFLKVLNGLLKPDGGWLRILGKDVRDYSPRELARKVATVPQRTSVTFAFTVWDVVLMGRYAHSGFFGSETRADHELALRILERTGTLQFVDRQYNELSGGEQQRVIVARALVQQPELLLLDEPTTHLDISYQKEILDLIARVNVEEDLTVVMVIHDINLASLYCDRLLLLKDGQVQASGTPNELITEELVQRVFGSPVLVFRHPEVDRPQVMFKTSVMS